MDREALRKLAAERRNVASEETVPTSKKGWACEHCGHDFASERVFMKHKCREKTRLMQLQTATGLAAYAYYSEWFRALRHTVPPIETFATSEYYSSFIKFAEHVKQVNMPNPSAFVKTMVENGKVPPSLWTRDNVYALYLQSYDAVVTPDEQFVESVEHMYELYEEYGSRAAMVFEGLGVEKVLALAQKRKLSSWYLVASPAFRTWMSKQSDVDKDRLERALQIGPMVMRIKHNAAEQKFFAEFTKAAMELGL